MKKTLITTLLIGIIAAGTSAQKSIGDQEVIVFKDEAVNFNPKENTTKPSDEVIKIDNGRIILKKVKLPKYSKDVRICIETELVSAGDPWDKTGSLFLIPSSSRLNFLIEQDKFAQLYVEKTDEEFPGIIPKQGYSPSIELLRFMTPFGVGHFSNDPKLMKRKPVYIPKWEEKVTWTEDITQLASELEDEVWIGAFIDVWTAEGYRISAKLNFEESKAIKHPKTQTLVIPLVNTLRYIDPERLFDGFNRQDIEYTFDIPKGYKSAKLYYITTGHGGHRGGDEFVRKENIVTFNGKVLYKDIPWRDDCASFRRYNPHSGVWTEKRIARVGNLKTGDSQEMEIEEFIASSDYSRSNWCPGSKVSPMMLDIKQFKEGKNTLKISIPEAQAETEDKLNHWNTSAYIVLTK